MCIVVGFIVGTGIFWRPGRVLQEAGGSLQLGIAAWIVGGLVISTCVYMFAIMASRYEKIHGMVDYAEAIAGKNYGYLAGWFFAIMYQSAGYAIIAWISASFTATFAGHSNVTNTPFVFSLALFYMVCVFLLNYFSPKIPIRLNNFTTTVRLIPLIAIGLAGLIWGNFGEIDGAYRYMDMEINPSFLGAVFATVFAYNGWQAAVAFNSEINNSKKKFPAALMSGFFLAVVIYVMYFIGVVTTGDPILLMENNQLGTRAAFTVFGEAAADFVLIFVIISGLGILNMCCMGMGRSLYSLGRRGLGPLPDKMAELKSGIPAFSMTTCFIVSLIWLGVIWANHNLNFVLLGQNFTFDLPDFYNMVFFALLIPIFIGFIIKNHNSNLIFVNKIIFPSLAVVGAGFMIFALVISNPVNALVYTGTFLILGAVGLGLK